VNALIVYDSVTGQTEKVALAISSGMKEVGFSEVTVKKAKEAVENDFRSADVWIFGSPTHFNGATGRMKGAVRTAIRSGPQGKRALAFDTKYAGVKKGATDKIVSMLSEAGVQMVLGPESFFVTKKLNEGEEARAATFGRKIAGALRP
jgi:flavodoxin